MCVCVCVCEEARGVMIIVSKIDTATQVQILVRSCLYFT